MSGEYRKLFDLSGKVALVTGGTGIIGTQLCRGLADCGAAVAVADLDGDRATELAAQLAGEYGVQALGIACDVSQPDQVKDMVAAVTAGLGGIDILANNAAGKSADLTRFFAPTDDYELETWREISAVNLDGMFLVAKEVGGWMRRNDRPGSIIQTASIYGAMGPDNRIYDGAVYMDTQINTPAVYSATKAGVIGLTRYLATTWAGDGIRVNTLTPGGVFSGQNETFVENYSRRIPMGRMAEAQEMVGAVVFLASDAASYVTGQNILVDGGLSAW